MERDVINSGWCPICEKQVEFVKKGPWLRDDYFCTSCWSIPRQRAIINALNKFNSNWREAKIHESSPIGASSEFIRRTCSNYTYSQYFPSENSGELVFFDEQNILNENLECMSFHDNEFDIFITQDVFEHIFNPEMAFKEIARVLKPGGMHIFTVPWYPTLAVSVCRAKWEDGEIGYLQSPVYHGNPVSDNGSLVTYDYGLDFINMIYDSSRMTTTIYLCENSNMGLEGELMDVFISQKFD